MLTKEHLIKLKASLIKHEGLKHFPYVDTMGNITIGIGYNLSDRGISESWINQQYQDDVSYYYNELYKFKWYRELDPSRQIVLIDMAFMGLNHLMSFTKMFVALEKKDYKTAAQEMLDSLWAKQVKGRAQELARAMETGIYE